VSKMSDMIDALCGRQPADAVPVWELEFHLWDQASGRHIVLGQEFAALSRVEQERALHANAEIMLSVSDALCFAALTVPSGYWEIAPGEPAYYWLPGEARYRQVEVLRQMAGDLVLIGNSGGVMAMPGAAEYVTFSYKLFDAPEEIDERAQATLERGLQQARRFCDLGVEAAYTASDIADNHGLFFSPAQMERFILPYLRRWAEGVREMGCYAILHTDGDVTACLEAFADSGLHALQAIDPVAGMDIRAVKAQVGDRLCLCGNVDCGLLVRGTPQEVYDQTRYLLADCAAGGGLVLGASNAVQVEASIENYRAMIDAWREYGQYGEGLPAMRPASSI
jgi:uroporphyrinogen decarboxylase